MLFQTPRLTDDEYEVVQRIEDVLHSLRYAITTAKRWTGLLRRDTFARAIRGSNTIEGYNVTIDDAVAAVEFDEPVDADETSWAALTGYRDAMTYILRLQGDPHFEYGETLLRSLHFMMLKYDLSKHPGQWRPGPIKLIDERRNRIVYAGPDADLVPGLMRELVAELANADTNIPVMVRAAMAHLNLVMIHPFSDGNGRMARALQTLVLAQEGILNPIFSSIEEYLGRNQDDYYRILAEVGAGDWSPGRNARPWVRFCLTAHYRCSLGFLRRSKEVALVWDEVENLVRRHGLPDRVEPALLMAVFGRRIRNSIYRKTADVSEQTASRDLKRLIDCGLLIPQGERRGRIYMGSEELLAIGRRASQPQVMDDPFEPTGKN